MLIELARVVPDGIVCFFVSYLYMDQARCPSCDAIHLALLACFAVTELSWCLVPCS
jgi:hypothetical protein